MEIGTNGGMAGQVERGIHTKVSRDFYPSMGGSPEKVFGASPAKSPVRSYTEGQGRCVSELPCYHKSGSGHERQLLPEENLLLALLYRACLDYLKFKSLSNEIIDSLDGEKNLIGHSRTVEYYQSARLWLFNDRLKYPFTARQACEQLGIDLARLRKRLQAKRSRPSPTHGMD